MDKTKDMMQKEVNLQWHPAFYATAQIELQEDAQYLIFENEHQLSTKPMAIDMLIIKNEQNHKIRKNIGRIFRKYNLVEYKSPTDYVSVDTFYKVYGYACFYKADTDKADTISVDEITITLFGSRYPQKLIKHLKNVRGYSIEKQEDGIYYVYGDFIPIQIVVGNQLSPKENLWLHGLTNKLSSQEVLEDLVKDYREHSENTWYQSAMNIIAQVNEEKFKEGKGMVCDALMKIVGDELEERLEKETEKRVAKETEKRVQKEVAQKIEQLNALYAALMRLGRQEDVVRATTDENYRKKLLEEFNAE
mgnify:CR=1 FL=1